MTNIKQKTKNLTNQQDALSEYLEALLTEVGFGDDDEIPESIPDSRPVYVVPEQALTTQAEVAIPEIPEPTVEVVIRPVYDANPDTESTLDSAADVSAVENDEAQHVLLTDDMPSAELVQSVSETADWNDDALPVSDIDQTQEQTDSSANEIVIPEWAEYRFQCLTFDIAGLKIAAPLEKLNGIIEWPGNFTVLPGHADWFVGLYRNRGQNVQIVDLAMILRGQSFELEDPEPVEKRAKYIMLVDDGRIGLASDTVANMLTLEPGDVKWRKDDQKLRIFAGTAVESMCSLLDVESLIKHIQQS